MQDCIFDNFSLQLLNTQITVCYCTDININDLITNYKNSKIELKDLNNYLAKNIWNRFYSITISLINLSNGINYNYTIPPEVLHEINDNLRLVISYQCECYNEFPNFTWINLWEYFINSKLIKKIST